MFAKKKVGVILGILGFFSWILVINVVSSYNVFTWFWMTSGGLLRFGGLLLPLLFIFCIIFAGIGKGKLMMVMPPIILAACAYNIYHIYLYSVGKAFFTDSLRFLDAIVSEADNFSMTEISPVSSSIEMTIQFSPVIIIAVLYFIHAFKRTKQADVVI